MNVRQVKFSEVNDPRSPWPTGFRPTLASCPVNNDKCKRGCGDICRDYKEGTT